VPDTLETEAVVEPEAAEPMEAEVEQEQVATQVVKVVTQEPVREEQ
jgi:hypothetical protein